MALMSKDQEKDWLTNYRKMRQLEKDKYWQEREKERGERAEQRRQQEIKRRVASIHLAVNKDVTIYKVPRPRNQRRY